MIVVSVQEAERDFAKVLDRVKAGEQVVIASEDKEIAVVSPVTKPSRPRIPGSAKGKIQISPDFDAPLPDDLLEGSYHT